MESMGSQRAGQDIATEQQQYKILTMGKEYNVNSLYYFCSSLILFQNKGLLKNSNSLSSHLKYKLLTNVSIKSKQDPCLSPQLHLPSYSSSFSQQLSYSLHAVLIKYIHQGWPHPIPLHLLVTRSGMFFTSHSSIFQFREAIVEHLSKIIFSPTLLS